MSFKHRYQNSARDSTIAAFENVEAGSWMKSIRCNFLNVLAFIEVVAIPFFLSLTVLCVKDF